MKRNNCSICPISGVSNDVLGLAFDGFFRFMPLSDFDEIPLYAGQDFIAPGAYRNVILDSNAAHAFHINTRLYGNHITWLKSNRLPTCHSRLFVHFQP